MMDILKRIDFVQQFAKEYADGAWSIDVDQWRHHVTPEFIEDVRQYIVSLQLKLMHEQTAQAKPYTYLWEADGTCEAVKGEIQISSNTGPCYGWKVTPLYAAPIPQQAQPEPFTPDWSKDSAAADSIREHQAICNLLLKEMRHIAGISTGQVKRVAEQVLAGLKEGGV